MSVMVRMARMKHISTTTRKNRRSLRCGAAAVEFAVLLPVLLFIFLVVLDFGRVYYGAIVAGTCARNGAFHAGYASNQAELNELPYASTGQAAAADGTDIGINPETDVKVSRDDANSTVRVTTTHRFELITGGLTMPNGGDVPRTIVMPEIPAVPQ